MSITRKRKLWTAALICAVGTVCQPLAGGCANYITQQALASFDFCAVFNCTGGTFFNFCEPVRLLVDCPATTTTQ